MTTYIVIADVAKARVFARYGKRTALEVADFVHPEGEAHTLDLHNRSTGAAVEARFNGASQVDDQAATMESHAAFFAKELAGYLRDVRANRQADEVVLVGAPQLLVVLRARLDAKTRELVTQIVNEDLAEAPHAEVQERLKSL